MKLSELPLGSVAAVTRVGGSGSFRRRLMELGLVPGTRDQVLGIAPLGDPLELRVRGASLSIRRTDATTVDVELEPALERPSAVAEPAELVRTGVARGAP